VSLLFVGLLHVERADDSRAAPIESFGQREGYFEEILGSIGGLFLSPDLH
jgi:hypothetical protein